MSTFGIDLREIEAQAPGSGWTPPDPGVQTFEIMNLNNGITKDGDPYVNLKAVQMSGEDPGVKSTSVFLGLSMEKKQFGIPAAQTKGILEAIGRHDIIEQGADADWNDLLGTIFEAEVKFVTDAKTGKQNPRLYNYVPISHAGIEAQQTADVTPTPEPAKAPTTMRRGR